MVELYLSNEVSYQELALQEGINNPAILVKWVNDFRIAGPDALRPKKKGRKKTLDIKEFKKPSKFGEEKPVDTSAEHVKELESARKSGFVRVRIDGIIYDLSEEIKLEKNKKHNIEIVVDRLVIKPEVRQRMTDSVEIASGLSGGLIIADLMKDGEIVFSQNYACDECGISIERFNDIKEGDRIECFALKRIEE